MTTPLSNSENIVMQTRCIYCGREQYGVAVFDISHGKHPCVWCGETPPVFTSEAEYRDKLKTLTKESEL